MSGTIGSRVKAARQRAWLTQTELAQAAGCSQQTIVDIESRSRSSKFLPAIARALGESADWFETGDGRSASSLLLVPHYDLYGLAQDPPVPIDRLWGSPDPGVVSFTVAIDAATVARSSGFLALGDVVFCQEPLGSRSSWAVVWAADWPKAELVRLAVAEGREFMGPPDGNRIDLATEVVLAESREEAAAAVRADGPLVVWIVASVFSIMRPC